MFFKQISFSISDFQSLSFSVLFNQFRCGGTNIFVYLRLCVHLCWSIREWFVWCVCVCIFYMWEREKSVICTACIFRYKFQLLFCVRIFIEFSLSTYANLPDCQICFYALYMLNLQQFAYKLIDSKFCVLILLQIFGCVQIWWTWWSIVVELI